MSKQPHERTPDEVMESRRSAGGCCERYADNMACDCMAVAESYQAGKNIISSSTARVVSIKRVEPDPPAVEATYTLTMDLDELSALRDAVHQYRAKLMLPYIGERLATTIAVGSTNLPQTIEQTKRHVAAVDNLNRRLEQYLRQAEMNIARENMRR